MAGGLPGRGGKHGKAPHDEERREGHSTIANETSKPQGGQAHTGLRGGRVPASRAQLSARRRPKLERDRGPGGRGRAQLPCARSRAERPPDTRGQELGWALSPSQQRGAPGFTPTAPHSPGSLPPWRLPPQSGVPRTEVRRQRLGSLRPLMKPTLGAMLQLC